MESIIKRLGGLLFIVCSSLCISRADNGQDTQDLQNFYNSLLPDFQILTPGASALGQYGNYRSSGYTGVPNISIPLFSIGSGNFSMPVELCYDASGIKVEQQATYVGLGWNLMLGGCITQIVEGQNDFSIQTSNNINFNSISNSDLFEKGITNKVHSRLPTIPQTDKSIVKFPGTPTNAAMIPLPIEEDRIKYDILRDVANGSRVPDIFQASFCGHNVSFIINTSNKEAKIISHDATSYKIELTDYSSMYPRGVKITDDNGIQYYFSESPITSTMDDRASYNLTAIKNAAGQRLAEFRYEKVGYQILQSYYETQGKAVKTPITDAIQKQFIDRNYPNTLGHGIYEYYPDTIITDREIILFYYGKREDIKGANRLDSIKVCANNSLMSETNRIFFNYAYFTENKDILCDRYYYSSVYNYKRLKLVDVTINDKTYSFEYNESENFPSRLSLMQDFWGYYNGQKNENGLCASPEYRYNDDKLFSEEVVGPANRYALESTCKIGTLNKVKYPTGGYSTFDYEIHRFDDICGRYYYPSATSNIKKINKIYSTCANNNKTNVKKFSVKSQTFATISLEITNGYKICHKIEGVNSDKVIYSRDFDDVSNSEYQVDLPIGDYTITSVLKSSGGTNGGGTICVSFPPEYCEDSTIGNTSGKSIGGGLRIATIKNYDNNNTLLGYTKYLYRGGKLLVPTVKKELINMAYLFFPSFMEAPIGNTGSCSFYFITSSPTYLAVCSLGCPNVGYSEVTNENYDKDGMLISYDVEKYNFEDYYNEGYNNNLYVDYNMFSVNRSGKYGKISKAMRYSSNGKLMHDVSYSYMSFGSDPSKDNIVFFPWSRCLDSHPGATNYEVEYKYSVYPKYPVVALPSSIVETTYTDKGDSTSIKTTYNYKESNFQVSEISKQNNSSSEIQTTRYWYPEDSEVAISSPTHLTKTHNISEKIKVVAYGNNDYIIGGYRNLYETLPNGLPVVKENFSISTDGSEMSELVVVSRDDYGNIREYKKKDGTPVTIIWSYSHQCPVIEVVGYTYSQVKSAYNLLDKLENVWAIIGLKSNAIHDAYTKIKRKLPDAHITAFTYSPRLTVSSITKPNGYTVSYQYDEYGRLISSSDGSGIIQRFYYNFGTDNK